MARGAWMTAMLAAAGLAACARSEPAHGRAYYLAHDAERTRELARCRNDPGHLAATPDCVNANAVDATIETQRFLAVKPTASRVTRPGSL